MILASRWLDRDTAEVHPHARIPIGGMERLRSMKEADRHVGHLVLIL